MQLGRRARFDGRLSGQGLALIHGELTSELDVDGDLIVPAGGRLVGARGGVARLRVEGEAGGKLAVANVVEVAAGGRLLGEVGTAELQSSPGATIEAHLRVRPAEPPPQAGQD